MICSNCHKELKAEIAPLGYCCCKNNHWQCIQCDRERGKRCAACNSPTEIGKPDFNSSAKNLEKSSEVKRALEVPQTSTQEVAIPVDHFFHHVEVDSPSNLSSCNDFFDPDLVISDIFDTRIEEHLENDLNPLPSITSSSCSSLRSLSLRNLFEDDDSSSPAPYAGSGCSSPPTIRSSHSQNSASSGQSDHTLTKIDNDDVATVENFRTKSALQSPKSVNPPSKICPFSPPTSDPETEKEKGEKPEAVCRSIDVDMQQVLEKFHESTSQPDWSKMDSRMPHIVRVLNRSYCPPEELPWRWLQTVSRVLKHDSEEAERDNKQKRVNKK